MLACRGAFRVAWRGLAGRQLATASASAADLACGVDLSKYPIHDLDSPEGRALVAKGRAAIAETGCASFPGFLRPEVTAAAAKEAATVAPDAFVTDAWHNAYQIPDPDASLPEDHVRNLKMRTRVASTAYDELDGPLRDLYTYDGLVDFVSAIVSNDLHRLADPLGACSINIFRPGWHHAWHFDESEFTTTLCLQQAEEGGEFEFTPPLRESQDDLAEGPVSRIVKERSGYEPLVSGSDHEGQGVVAHSELPPIATAPFEPGTLQIFAGRYSLHHVKSIPEHPGITKDRLVAVLCFASEPGLINSPSVQEMFWGRTVQPNAAA